VSLPRVHQVLATLGYGDAIGHEVLGIQRVLQGAGYESEIFVETADRRLESLTTDYREMVGAIAPEDVLVHHFSIGSRASRTVTQRGFSTRTCFPACSARRTCGAWSPGVRNRIASRSASSQAERQSVELATAPGRSDAMLLANDAERSQTRVT